MRSGQRGLERSAPENDAPKPTPPMTPPITIAGKFAASTATTISDAKAATAAAPKIVARRGASWPSHTPAMAAAAG